MQHRARKRFGQNFLHDNNIIRRIIASIAPKTNDTLIEIGPGMGAITKHLLKALDQLTVVEIDRDLIALLTEKFSEQLTIIDADVLTVDFKQFQPKPLRIVGNLPYNISTPLLFHLLDSIDDIQDMTFMLQKEVVERICAAPGDNNYGRLSVMIQYHCQTKHCFNVPNTAFQPAPKVESAILQLRPHQQKKYCANDEVLFAKVVKNAFMHRRKTLANNLKALISAEQLSALCIDPKQRAEKLNVPQFVTIANAIQQSQ